MLSFLKSFLWEFWNISCLMAPWLLFGFLIGGLIAVFISNSVIKKHLGGKGFTGILKASLIGVFLPLCSCGVIPVGATLKRQGASKGTVASFITSTPQIGFSSFIPAWQLVGSALAIIKALFALITGILAGVLVNAFCPEKPVTPAESAITDEPEEDDHTSGNKIIATLKYAFITLMGDVGPSLVFGLFISALIGALLPGEFAAQYASNTILVIPAMILLSMPLYVCSNAAIPIAATLLLKGFTPGAALAFLIAGPSCSAPMIASFWKILGRRAAFIYIALMVSATLLVCWGIDYFHASIPGLSGQMPGHGTSRSWLEISCALLMFAIMSCNFLMPWFYKPEKLLAAPGQILFQVNDMTCENCLQTITTTINALTDARLLKANLSRKQILVAAPEEARPIIIEALKKAGFNAN